MVDLPAELPPAASAAPAPVAAAKPAAPAVPPGPIALPALSAHDSVSEQHTVKFATDKNELDDDDKEMLSSLADRVKKSQSTVRVVAYASGTAEQASVARRISMGRSLVIRAFLIDKGVNPQSINAVALGNQKDADSAEISVK